MWFIKLTASKILRALVNFVCGLYIVWLICDSIKPEIIRSEGDVFFPQPIINFGYYMRFDLNILINIAIIAALIAARIIIGKIIGRIKLKRHLNRQA